MSSKKTRFKGFIARGVKNQVHSYTGYPQNDDQKYELTQDECNTMSAKINQNGLPLTIGHNQATDWLDMPVLGRICASKFDEGSGDWEVEFEVDMDEPATDSAFGLMDLQKKPFALSLKHDQRTLNPMEISLCLAPARPGSYLTEMNGVPYNMQPIEAAAKPTPMDTGSSKGDAAATPSSHQKAVPMDIKEVDDLVAGLPPEKAELIWKLKLEGERAKKAAAAAEKQASEAAKAVKEAEEKQAAADKERKVREQAKRQVEFGFFQELLNSMQSATKDNIDNLHNDLVNNGRLNLSASYGEPVMASLQNMRKQLQQQQQLIQQSPQTMEISSRIQQLRQMAMQQDAELKGAMPGGGHFYSSPPTQQQQQQQQIVEGSRGYGGGGGSKSREELLVESLLNNAADTNGGAYQYLPSKVQSQRESLMNSEMGDQRSMKRSRLAYEQQ